MVIIIIININKGHTEALWPSPQSGPPNDCIWLQVQGLTFFSKTRGEAKAHTCTCTQHPDMG